VLTELIRGRKPNMWKAPWVSRRLADKEKTEPRVGDTLVTLRVDEADDDKRAALLMYAFVKAAQGALLRRVIDFDLVNGEISFIICDATINPWPRGRLKMELAGWPGQVKEEPVTGA
jgi:hypothetical protein